MKYKLILMLLVLFIAVPAGTAFALPEEEVIDREISTGYYDIWKHSDGTWQVTGRPGGWHNVVAEAAFRADKLRELGGDWTITRVEATGEFGRDEYEYAGGWWGDDWERYNLLYYRYRPKTQFTTPKLVEDFIESQVVEANGKTAEAPMDDELRQSILTYFEGETIPVWIIELWNQFEMQEGYGGIDLTNPAKRQQYGLPPKTFSDDVEGWRIFLPALITWYGVPKEEINLVASSLDPGITGDEAEPGERYTATIKLKCFGVGSAENVPIGGFNGQYRATLKKNGQSVTNDNLTSGDIKTYTFDWTAPESGETVLKGVIDTPPLENKYSETTENDNIIEETVFVRQPPAPPSTGNLSFQATSQGGKDIYGEYISPTNRPANTAKWEDMVTATLKPPAPNPPRGTLKSWSITSASITIPVQHPQWSFNTPYAPVSKKTLNMTASGHTATAQFKEDWAIDGFNSGSGAPGVYSHIEERIMADKPQPYTITATYAIKYTYEYKVRRCSGSGENRRCRTVTRTGSGTDSGTASANLLINGAGKVPY